MNAILIKGDAAGVTMYYGRGRRFRADGVGRPRRRNRSDAPDAPAEPEERVPYLAFQPDAISDVSILPMGDVETSYYLRVRALDRPGVLADVTRICADLDISIDAIFQKEAGEGEEQVDVVILTHTALEKKVNAAIARIEALPTIPAPVVRIRLEELL